MIHNRNIKEAISQLGGTFGKNMSYHLFCTVDSVDENAATCSCTPISGDAITGLENVLLKSEGNDGFMLVPAIGSTVVVLINKTDPPCVFMYEDIDKVIVIIGGSKLIITDGLVEFNGGALGGLTKTRELQTQINKTNAVVNAILTILTGPPINEPGNGAPSALQTSLAAALAGKSVGDFSNIEDTTITH